jgi:hypothetical protein
MVSTVKQDLGSDSGDEMRITTIGVQGKNSFHVGSSSTSKSHDNERRRSELFHIRVVSKHTNIDTLFDLGSQVNLISETIVKKLGVVEWWSTPWWCLLELYISIGLTLL